MKSSKLLASFFLFMSTVLNAGGMGAVQASKPTIYPFIGAEGSYTWSNIVGYNMNVADVGLFTSDKVTQGFGGRVSAGLLDQITENFLASAEMGWAYYGRVKLNPMLIVPSGVAVFPATNSMHVTLDQYGLDVLAGVVYTKPTYDLFFKAGALFENLRIDAAANTKELLAAAPALVTKWNGKETLRYNLPQVLPEIKLGGAYHITQKTVVTLAWMHAFGSTFSFDAPALAFNPTSLGNLTLNLQSPTLNSVMFGLEHRFS